MTTPDGHARSLAAAIAPVAARVEAVEALCQNTLAAVRALVTLLTPRDEAHGRDELGETLAEIIALERRILSIASANQRSLRTLTGEEQHVGSPAHPR